MLLKFKFGAVLAEILGKISIFAVSSKSYRNSCRNLCGVCGLIAIKLAQNVTNILLFNTCKSELRYWNPFRNASMLNGGHFANFANNWLPWQCPLRNRKRGSDQEIQITTYHCVKKS